MDVAIAGRNCGITDRFRGYVNEKVEKVGTLAERPLALEVKVSKHHEKNGAPVGAVRVELTLIGPGPIVRSEAEGPDKYVAFDAALARMMERLRRAKDRKKVHRGQHRPVSLHDATANGLTGVVDIVPATPDVLARVRTGQIPVAEEQPADLEEDYSPVVIRHKVFPSSVMTAEDAVDHMELVGHDFFLFIDARTDLPSVVYRRKGWDYGVISLAAPEQAAAKGRSLSRASR